MRISFNKKQGYSGKITKMQTQNTKIPRGELHLQDEHITQNITKKGPNVHNKQTKTPKRNKTTTTRSITGFKIQIKRDNHRKRRSRSP